MTELDDAGPRTSTDQLRRVARYHRWVIAAALAQVTLWVVCLVLVALGYTDFSPRLHFPVVLTVALGGVGGVYTFLVYWTLRKPVLAVVMGLASVPPLLGLFSLLAVNGTATRTLAADGVEVGLFGADLDATEHTPGLTDEDGGW
jgi:hypothetical protein